MKLNKQIFGWLGASALLLSATSCVNDSLSPEPQLDDATDAVVYGNGSSIVTVNITPDSYVGTRSVSDGAQATSLYFEVYDLGSTGNENTQIIGSTGGGTATTVFVSMITNENALTITNYKKTIKLAVEETHNYRISLWAANKDKVGNDNLFTISSPLHVDVDYSKIKNNADAMDAFCATKYFTGTAKSLDVVLHRPFAQLNVGTTGADYNNYKEGNIIPNKTITYSKVVVTGVSNGIDVANDKIDAIVSENNKNIATFEFGQTIAEQTKNSEEYLKVKLNDPKLSKVTWGTSPKDRSVSLADGADFFSFKNRYPTIKNSGDNVTGLDANQSTVSQSTYYLTEEFKYLSMCYVLVPSGDSDNFTNVTQGGTWNDNDKMDDYKSSTLTSVDVYFAEDPATGSTNVTGQKYFTVKNVPVHRNWRTNLLGGLADASYPDPKPGDDPDPDPDPENPDPDPDGPDDPSSLFYNVKIAVYLCPIYWGEFNGQNAPTTSNGYTPINAGWFPTESDNNLHDDFYHKGETPSSGSEE